MPEGTGCRLSGTPRRLRQRYPALCERCPAGSEKAWSGTLRRLSKLSLETSLSLAARCDEFREGHTTGEQAIPFYPTPTPGTKIPRMTRVRINYDGWLSLPTAVRQKLGLTTGDQLELELADGSIILRPVRSGAVDHAIPEPVTTAGPPIPAAPELPAAAAASPIVKRGPGRPRKSALPTIPPTLKARGGKRKAASADGSAS